MSLVVAASFVPSKSALPAPKGPHYVIWITYIGRLANPRGCTRLDGLREQTGGRGERFSSAEQCTFPAQRCRNKAKAHDLAPWAGRRKRSGRLAVTRYGAQLARQEVVWRPRSADRHFAVLQLFSGGAIAVLVLFYALGIDQVGDVD